jgi:hypothetical protein
MNDMIAPPVLTVLHQSHIDGARLYLPPTQLDRKLYVSVNEVIARLGGKWQGGKIKAHVFEDAESAALLREAESVEIITVPPRDAWAGYAGILADCLARAEATTFYLSCGPTATVLAADLCATGRRALDMGAMHRFWRGGKLRRKEAALC